jgi:acetolactate synthase-1/2/3 large subunit
MWFGVPGGLAPIHANRVLFGADRILFLGARLDLGTTAFQRAGFGDQADRLMIDIDPAELAKFEGLSNARALQADLAELPKALALTAPPRDHGQWARWCSDERARESAEEESRLASPALTLRNFARALEGWAEGRIIAPTGSGAAIEAFLRFYAPPANSRCFFGASLGAMGLGLPHALGAAFAGMGPVAALEGDGGLMLNLQELATLREHRPKGFVLFVLNNDGYQSIRASQSRHFGGLGGADSRSGVFLPSLSALGAAFELPVRRVETLEALDALLGELGPASDTVLVDLVIPPDEPRGPAVRTVIDEQGRVSSTSLADIGW